MENSQHQSGNMERRVMSRIDAALRINYQIISGPNTHHKMSCDFVH